MEHTNHLRAVLNDLRTASGMTYRELADATGIPYGTLRRRLKDESAHIFLPDLCRFADIFDVRPSEIVQRAETRLAQQ